MRRRVCWTGQPTWLALADGDRDEAVKLVQRFETSRRRRQRLIAAIRRRVRRRGSTVREKRPGHSLMGCRASEGKEDVCQKHLQGSKRAATSFIPPGPG